MDITLSRILSLIPTKPDGSFVHGAKKDFAQTVGLKSGNLISDWINGRSRSYTNYIYEISAKYNVSVEWLKGKSDIKEQKNNPALNNENEISDEYLDIVRATEEVRGAKEQITTEEFIEMLRRNNIIRDDHVFSEADYKLVSAQLDMLQSWFKKD